MKNKYNTLLFLAGLAVFIYLMLDFGPENILMNIKRTGLWIMPAVGIWTIVYLINTLSIYIIMGESRRKIGYFRTFAITLSGFALNYITPLVSIGGEPYRIIKLSGYLGQRMAVSKVILYKMLQWLSHIIFWLFAILISVVVFHFTGRQILYLALISSAFVFTVSFMLSRHKHGFLLSLYNLSIKLTPLRKLLSGLKITPQAVEDVDANIMELYNSRRMDFYTVLALEFISRILAALEFNFILASVGMAVSLADAVFIHAASSLAMNIMFFVPFELGVRESSLFFLLNTLFAGTGIGIYVSLVNRIRELFWILIGVVLIRINNGSVKNKIFETAS